METKWRWFFTLGEICVRAINGDICGTFFMGVATGLQPRLFWLTPKRSDHVSIALRLSVHQEGVVYRLKKVFLAVHNTHLFIALKTYVADLVNALP